MYASTDALHAVAIIFSIWDCVILTVGSSGGSVITIGAGAPSASNSFGLCNIGEMAFDSATTTAGAARSNAVPRSGIATTVSTVGSSFGADFGFVSATASGTYDRRFVVLFQMAFIVFSCFIFRIL
jgi:hypothetical protein